MKEIRNVAILGAGAMGAAYASRFVDSGQFSTVLVADGSRYDRLVKEGCVVNGKRYLIPVLKAGEASQPCDLIVVALKNHNLPEAVPYLKNIVGPQTTLISVMNGLDSEKYLGSAYEMDKVLYAIAVGIDAVREGNAVSFTNPGKIIFGEASNPQLSDRVLQVQEAFRKAGISYETPPDMIRMLWWKFMINVGINQASAVMRAPYGVFQASVDAQDLMRALMREVISLAQASGVNLQEDDIDDWNRVLKTLSPQGKTSMLQDIEAGRKTEVEIFAGKVVDLGRSFGIPTPVNQTLLSALRVMEQTQNDN
ncbi:MAG: ketopantoate reductase family protein [Desulfomonilaceae bacterium]